MISSLSLKETEIIFQTNNFLFLLVVIYYPLHALTMSEWIGLRITKDQGAINRYAAF